MCCVPVVLDIHGYPIVIGVKVRGYRKYLEEIEETER